jgi:threonine 3-dehydrogenase
LGRKKAGMAKLITGGTGFVGAELARMLVALGEETVVFDIAINLKRIDDIRDKVKTIQGDLGSWSEVCDVVKNNKITTIYHLGSLLGVMSEVNPWESFRTNIIGTYNVLEAARLFDVEKVMFTSSMATFRLETGAEITDTTIQRPTNMYGVGKLYGEGLGRYYRKRFGLDFRAIRYPGILGPGVKAPGLWPSLMIENAVLGKPFECIVAEESAAPLIFFRDAARAADMVLHAPREKIKMVNYNVGMDVPPVSAKQLEQAIKRHVPEAVITYKPDPAIMEMFGPFSKIKVWDDSCARREWDWKPDYPTIESMVSAFIEEIRAHPDRYGL